MSKAGGVFKWLPNEEAIITSPILTAFLEAGANPNGYSSKTKPIFYETILNWESGQEIMIYNQTEDMIEQTQNFFRNNLTGSEIPPLLANVLNDEVKQAAMFLSNEEVIERMKILVKYKADLTFKDEKPVIEFFMQEFFRVLRKKIEHQEGYSSNDDLSFAAEVVSILKKAGANIKSAKKYLEAQKNSYRNYPDIVKELDTFDKIINLPTKFIKTKRTNSSNSSSSIGDMLIIMEKDTKNITRARKC